MPCRNPDNEDTGIQLFLSYVVKYRQEVNVFLRSLLYIVNESDLSLVDVSSSYIFNPLKYFMYIFSSVISKFYFKMSHCKCKVGYEMFRVDYCMVLTFVCIGCFSHMLNKSKEEAH